MSARSRTLLAVAVGLLLAAPLGVAAWKAYRHLYFDRTPAYRASEPLMLAALRNKALTPDEFARTLALCDCGEPIVELRMFAAVTVAVNAEASYKPRAVELFTRLAADPSDPQRQTTAALQLKRLTDPPAAP